MSNHSKHMKHQLSPLTEENLLKMNGDTYDAIERYYCSSGNEAPTCHQLRIQTQTHHHRTTPTPQRHQPRSRRASRDVVMESPRLLPFPYHNDCHFLPTAEHKQHQQKKKMGTGSFSDLSLRSHRTSMTATLPSSTTIPLSYSARRAASTPHSTRHSPDLQRSSSSTSACHLDPLLEPSLSSSSSSSSFSSGSSFYKKGSSFLARLLNLMKKKNSSTPSPPPSPSPSSSLDRVLPSSLSATNTADSPRLPKKNLVWFAEFAVNPPPPNGMVVTAA